MPLDLIDALIARQTDRQWTDAEMAESIGLSRVGWLHVRTRTRDLSRAAIAGVLLAYPDLAPQVEAYLLSFAPQRDAAA